MSKKAIFLTFLSAVAVVCLAAVLSYLVWANQPQADSNPPMPLIPTGAPTEKPPVPAIPRLAGDILDDGIVDALDEIKPKYPIVIRRAGPHEEEGMRLMKECGERNGLTMKLFGKEASMSETAGVLMEMVGK